MSKQVDYIKTALRLPRELHQNILDEATEKGRSLNAEFIDILSHRTNAKFNKYPAVKIQNGLSSVDRIATHLSALPIEKLKALSVVLGIKL